MNEYDVDRLWRQGSRTRCAYLVPFPETATDCTTAEILPNPLYTSTGGWSNRIRQLRDGDFIWIEAHSNRSRYLFSYEKSTTAGLRKVSPETLKKLTLPFLGARCHWIFHVCDGHEFGTAFKKMLASSQTPPLSVVAGVGIVRPDDFPGDLGWVP